MTKVTQAQKAATKKYEGGAYFKTLVRFPADVEDKIRVAAKKNNRSLNNFIVAAVCIAAGMPEPELKEPGKKPKNKKLPKTARGATKKPREGSDS
jgi:hypothetical protein